MSTTTFTQPKRSVKRPDRHCFAIIVEISQSLRGSRIALVALSLVSINSMRSVGILTARKTGPAKGHRRRDEKSTGFGRR
jgi:hypothetical protein